MITIWKFPFPAEFAEKHPIAVPAGAQFLSVGVQDNRPVVWAMVDTEHEMVKSTLCAYGTGQDLSKEDSTLSLSGYIGTVQIDHMVWHIFVE